MADIKISALLETNGTFKEGTKDAQAFNAETSKTKQLIKEVNQAQRGRFAASAAGRDEGYGTARGTVGTGAAGRDFAKQSQGLGGLVRLYATFAANIFAVGAAFQNLNQAAGFERMMVASDKMSTIVGTNLRQTAKNLQEVTGYAISFEDAMQFTNIGTSAGLAAKDIQNLVQIAKGAAAGLGRDVNDAVKRIIQGTAKQEQEILDELGIFVKAKKAYDDYAKKFDIKGGADALTAQQRVAAYATAVAEAGEKWKEFAEIDDPFARFIANGKEAIQTILTTVNKLVIPIFKFINESGDAITAIILGVSGLLAKRALPELKSIITELFTFDKARARAQADEARNEVLSKYNQTTKELVALEKQRADLMLQATPTREMIAKAVGAEAAVRGKKGGVSVQQLGTAILGTETKPLDVSKIKEVEQVENKVLGTLRNQLRATKEKNELLEAFKTQQLVSNTATLESLTLGDRGKQIAKDNFDIISQTNTKRAQALALETAITEKLGQKVSLEKQMTLSGISPGATTPTPKPSAKQATGLPPQQTAQSVMAAAAGAQTAADTAKNINTLSASMSRGEKIVSGWSEGLAKSNEYMSNLNATADKGWKQSFKNFVNITGSGIVSLGQLGKELGGVGRAAAVTGGAISLLGTVAVGAFRAIMAAFGPLVIVFTLWEMFGDKIIPKAWKETQEYAEKVKSLNEVFATSASTFSRVSKESQQLNYGFDQYAKNIEALSNAIQSQIDAIEELKKKRQEAEKVDQMKKAREEAEKQGKAFSEMAYSIGEFVKTTEIIQSATPEQIRELEDLATKISDVALRQKQLKETLTKDIGPVYYIKNALGSLTPAEKALQAEAQKLNELYAARMGLVKTGLEQSKAENGQVIANRKATEDAVDSIKRKLKNTPKLGDIAQTEDARALAKSFDEALKLGPDSPIQVIQGKVEDIGSALEQLSKEDVPGATDAWLLFNAALKSDGYVGALQFLKDSPEIFKKFLQGVNSVTQAYTPEVIRQFSKIKQEIDDATYAIQGFDFSLSKTQALNQRNASVRGFAIEAEIAAVRQLELAKAQEEYNRTLAQARQERDKVILKAGSEEGTAAGDAAVQDYNNKKRSADLTLQQAKFNADNAAINNTISSKLTEISKKYEEIGRNTALNNQIQNNILKLEETRLQILEETEALTKTDSAKIKSRLEALKLENTYQQGLKAAEDDRKKALEEAATKGVAGSKARADAEAEVERIYNNKVKLLQDDRDTSREILDIVSQQKILYAQLADYEKEITHQQNLRQIAFDTETEVLSVEKEILSVRREMGLISADQYSAETKRLRNLELERQAEQKKLNIQNELAKKLRDIETRAAAAEEAKYGGDPMAPWMQDTGFEDEARRAREEAAIKVAGIDRVLGKNKELQVLMDSLTEDQKAYAEVFKGTFDGMADAMVEWAKTGKWAGKDLIDSLIADLARLYLRKQMMGLFEMGMSAIFGSPKAAASGWGAGDVGFMPGGGMAKGGAFDDGIRKFAKGGAFTNTIVSSPTLFKFAKGTGLMGEAGPEAIMPLKRDQNGNLGVRATTQQKTEVVVNNYSGQPAQAKETEDARGNRRVEIIVGDMTAGEVTRNGSSTNKAMRSTFGLQPQLIRR